MVFELGVRKDWENLPETFVAGIKGSGCKIEVQTDVASILRENGQGLDDVGAIIWSHWHFDHAGDPQTFPSKTDLIVGPGFKSNMIPAYPTVRDSHVNETAWEGRDLVEIDFKGEKSLQIGKFEAYDFYGDGSFYLLSSPGHATINIYAPPRDDFSNPLGRTLSACPGRLFLSIHPWKDPERPSFDPTTEPGWHLEAAEAKQSINKLIEADAYDNIFPVMAHDMTLGETVELYPKKANDWMARGWKEETRWGFCGEYTPMDEMDGKGQHAQITGPHEIHGSTEASSKIMSIAHLEYKEGEKKAELQSLPL